MALAVVLFNVSEDVLRVGPDALDALAALGVTNVALVRDGSTGGLVLDGWAFDADRAPDAARAALGVGDDALTLRPLMRMAVVNELPEGGRR